MILKKQNGEKQEGEEGKRRIKEWCAKLALQRQENRTISRVLRMEGCLGRTQIRANTTWCKNQSESGALQKSEQIRS